MTAGDPHAVFIWSAYAVTGLMAAALVVLAAIDHRRQVRALEALEGRPSADRESPRVGG